MTCQVPAVLAPKLVSFVVCESQHYCSVCVRVCEALARSLESFSGLNVLAMIYVKYPALVGRYALAMGDVSGLT